MNKTPTDEERIPPEFEPMFETLLIQFDEALSSGGQSGRIPEELKSRLPEGLQEELDATQSCLRLLHQMQLQSGMSASNARQPSLSPDPHLAAAALQNVEQAGKVIGRFEIERKLGEGTYGLVFAARDRDLNRRVALKIPRPEALVRSDLQARFLREAQAAAALSHPNIVAVYHASAANGLHYIASEFIDGPNLSEWLDAHDRQPVEPRQAASLIASLAAGVDHAHTHGILHRDIKPGNILLVPKTPGTPISGSLERFEPKLTDFGLAKTTGTSQDTLSGTILGTPAYMAPEQISGKLAETGPAADVYALGVILAELLTGKNLFVGEGYEQTLQKVLHQECPPLRRINPHIPHDLAVICATSLQKDSWLRYRSAADLANDLRSFLTGQPIRARSLSMSTRLQKWCRRNPGLAIAGSVSLLSLLALLTTTLRHNIQLREANVRIQQERDSAEKERQSAITSREQAVRNQQLALKMMQNLVTNVQEKLATRPAMEGVRRELLQTAQQGLEELAQQAEGPQNDITRAYLQSVVELSGVYLMYGEASKCEQILTDALQLGLAAAKKNPSDEELQRIIASLYQTNGSFLLKIGRIEAAITNFQKDVNIRQDLANRLPGDKGRRMELAKALLSVGHAHNTAGDTQKALKYYRESVAIGQPLVDTGDHDPELIYQLAFGHRKVGDLMLLNFGEIDAAKKAYSQALANVQLGVKADPDNHRLWLSRTAIHRGLADTALRQGDRTTARKEYQEYLDWALKLYAADPASDRSIRETLVAYERIGDFESQEGKWPEARQAWLEELKLVEILVTHGPQNVDHHSNTLNLVQRFLGLGDLPHAQAASVLSRKMVDAAAKLGDTNPTYLSMALAHALNHGQIIKQTADFSPGTQDYQAAVRFSEQLSQLNSQQANSQLTLAHSLYQAGIFEVLYLGQTASAEKLLNRASKTLQAISPLTIPSRLGEWKDQIALVERMQGILRTVKDIDNLELIRKQPANSQFDLLMIRSRKAFQDENVPLALSTVEALAELTDAPLLGKFEAACILARSAGLRKTDSDKLNQKALRILEECATKGHFQNLWNLGQLLSRHELNAIREKALVQPVLNQYQPFSAALSSKQAQ